LIGFGLILIGILKCKNQKKNTLEKLFFFFFFLSSHTASREPNMEDLPLDTPVATFSCTRYGSRGTPYRGTMTLFPDRLEFAGRAVILITQQRDVIP
jgi:hypothetical protein